MAKIDNLKDLYKTKNLFFIPIVMKMGKAKLEIGENNVFHSLVYLFSEGGDIKIGNINIFEEKVFIYNRSKTETMIIGNENYFKIGCRIYSTHINNLNEFGINSLIEQCKIGDGNIIGADTKIKANK